MKRKLLLIESYAKPWPGAAFTAMSRGIDNSIRIGGKCGLIYVIERDITLTVNIIFDYNKQGSQSQGIEL